MEIGVVYTNKSKYCKSVLEPMARWAKTYARSIDDYHHEHLDLLVIGFDSTIIKDKQLINFISSLNRNEVNNVVLIHCCKFKNNSLDSVVKMCQENHLPLMREQYIFKVDLNAIKKFHRYGCLDDSIIDAAKLYIDDMINVIHNYY